MADPTPSNGLEHAFLALHLPEHGGKKMGKAYAQIDFMFNPCELTIQRKAEWKDKPSKKPQVPEYNGASASNVTLEMFVDASEGGEVKTTVDKLLAAVLPSENSDRAQKPVAPYVSFGWGSVTYVPCAVVESVSAKYTRFAANGSAIRAVVTVTLREIMPSLVKQNPTSTGRGAQAVLFLRDGATLAAMATEELGAPSRWRAIAEANDIDDPLRLRPGRWLVVPTPSGA